MPPKFSRELQQPVIFADFLDFQPRTSPCEADCPAGNPIQKISYLVRDHRFEEAAEYLRARNPFPGVCGRVCPHPCEGKCNRSRYDESVSIRALERAVFDLSEAGKVRRPLPMDKTGKRISIIGSGPAGMTCAYFSSLFGHSVTIFEGLPFLGGMMRSGIPDHRLPKDVLDREIGQILDLGIESKLNTVVGKDVALAEIMAQYDACLIAAGRRNAKSSDISGSRLGSSGMLLGGNYSLNLTRKGILNVDPRTMATSLRGVFAAGDISGPTGVAEAIGSGRRAAIGIHQYLTNHLTAQVCNITMDRQEGVTVSVVDPESKVSPPHVVTYEELSHIDYFEKKPRVATGKMETGEATKKFLEADSGYTREQAAEEASRCFHCGHCFMCGSCVEDCPGYVLAMGADGPTVAYPEECWHCGNCRISCPCGAVAYEFPLSMLV